MLNWLSKEFLIATIGALTIAVVVLSLFGPPHYIEPPGYSGSENSERNENVANPNSIFQIECNPNCTLKRANDVRSNPGLTGLLYKFVDDPVIGLTGGILLANFLLVLAVWGQIREARKSTEARLRAYVVVVVGTQFRQGGTRGLRFEFRPVMLNTGQTPAYEMRSVARIRFMTLVEASTFDFTLPDPSVGTSVTSAVTLGPRQDRFVQTIYDGRLSKTELREFKRLQKALFVYGTTYYRDAFDKPRYTNFCFAVGWWNKRGPPLWQTVMRHSDSN